MLKHFRGAGTRRWSTLLLFLLVSAPLLSAAQPVDLFVSTIRWYKGIDPAWEWGGGQWEGLASPNGIILIPWEALDIYLAGMGRPPLQVFGDVQYVSHLDLASFLGVEPIANQETGELLVITGDHWISVKPSPPMPLLIPQRVVPSQSPNLGHILAGDLPGTQTTGIALGPGARQPIPPPSPTEGPRIALTFDDGPHPVFTPQILEILGQHQVRATFFLLGWRVLTYPTLVRRIHSSGHEIGNHSYDHPNLTHTSLSEARNQIARTQQAVERVAGVTPKWFRPPYGAHNPDLAKISEELGVRLVLWNLNSEDWQTPNPDQIVRHVLEQARDGSIVLFHDISQTAQALPRIIEGLRARGFQFVTVSEILHRPER